MKKELNGKSRRKWVVGGAMVFGSVALLSTGFATWVIGASNTSSDGSIGVVVDSVSNKSVDFKATIAENDTIKISDPANSGTGGVVTTGATDTQDLTVSVSLELICSEEYLNGNEEPGAVSVAWQGTSNMITASTITSVHGGTGAKVNWNNKRNASSKITTDYDAFTVFKNVYIAKGSDTSGTQTSISPDWTDWTKDGAYNVSGSYKFTATVSLNFTLGDTDLWNNKSTFCDFVNSMYTADMVGEGKTFTYEAEMNGEIETEMEAELKALETYFQTTKPTVTLSVADTLNAPKGQD